MKERILYYDILNIVATFGVVAMHCNGLVHHYQPGLGWLQALSVDALFYWAVPIFFMLTGANLLGYQRKYGTKEFFKKRVLRTFIPFIIWATIAYVWQCAHGWMSPPTSVSELISAYLNTEMMGVYWFFIALFSVYLAIPVFASLVNDSGPKATKILWYVVILGFTFCMLLPNLLPLGGIEYNDRLVFPLSAGGCIIYAVLGYLVANHEFGQRARLLIYLGGIAALLLRLVTTAVFSGELEGVYKVFWGYTNFPTFFLVLAVFVLFKQIKWEKFFKSENQISLVVRIASASFGVYLIHMFIIRETMFIFDMGYDSWVLRLGAPLLIYLICLAVSLLFKKIPVIKRIIP